MTITGSPWLTASPNFTITLAIRPGAGKTTWPTRFGLASILAGAVTWPTGTETLCTASIFICFSSGASAPSLTRRAVPEGAAAPLPTLGSAAEGLGSPHPVLRTESTHRQ